MVRTRRRKHDETYRIAVGKASQARDQHRELVVSLEETAAPHWKLDIAFRAFNDGIAFRYQIPAQERLAEFVLTEERTELIFPGDPKARVLPLDSHTTPYEKIRRSRPRTIHPHSRPSPLPLFSGRRE